MNPKTIRTKGVEVINAERERQISVEGFDAEHDANHSAGSLVAAGECYVMYASLQLNDPDRLADAPSTPPLGWPWGPNWWKPSESPQRNLAKGGALLAAAIDRLQSD